MQKPSFDTLLAWYFVLIWGSGFVATKVALQYTAPLTLVTLRFAMGLILMLPLAWLLRFRWPQTRRAWMHVIIAGLFLHALYLSGTSVAQSLGMSAGTTALILAGQPLLTAFIAALWMTERLARAQWAGIFLGLAGMLLVVWHKIDIQAVTVASLIAVTGALAGTTCGSLYQRAFCPDVDLRSASLIQFGASLLVVLPFAWNLEGFRIEWAWQLIAAAAFLVIAASLLALNAFHLLMRRGQATRVATLIYLTPIITVVLEYLVFGVLPTLLSLAGMAIVCCGVALVAVRPRREVGMR